jgi:transcription antitermination factor NusG
MHQDFWHVLQVVANHEKRVAEHLSVRLIEHFLPLYTERSRWTDRSVQLERPLFTGYVFIRFSPPEKLSVISTPGAIRLLGDSDTQRVSPVELDRIRESLASGHSLRPRSSVPVGTQVRIRGGVFEGVKGVVTELRQQCKVIIVLTAVQQCFSLEVGLEDVEVMDKIIGQPVGAPNPMRLARA